MGRVSKDKVRRKQVYKGDDSFSRLRSSHGTATDSGQILQGESRVRVLRTLYHWLGSRILIHPLIRKQTLQHVLEKKADYMKLDKTRMGIWAAMEKLNELVDESDPDTSLSQIAHLLQSAEAARRDGQPRWMILTCLIHDLGKYLFFLGEPQWTVSQMN